MEDSTASERLQSQKRLEELDVRGLLDSAYIACDIDLDVDTIAMILKHIDCFVEASQGNSKVQKLCFRPSALIYHDDNVCDKLGEAVGNLQGLKRLVISTRSTRFGINGHHEDGIGLPIRAWEKLARILSRVQQNVSIELYDNSDVWAAGDVRAFARVIRGHPMITHFDSGKTLPVPHESLDTLYSALATLPDLQSIQLFNRRQHTRPEGESLTELLRAPALRSVDFGQQFFGVSLFTPGYCQAIANAFMEGTAITRLKFTRCSFSAGECAAFAEAFSRNTSVSYIKITIPCDQALYSALTTALPLNSTLQELCLGDFSHNPSTHVDCSPIFWAIGKNTGLKTLRLDYASMDESLCTAMQNGLGTNTTLEHLSSFLGYTRDDTAELWHRAFSFLRKNHALKSLRITLNSDVTKSRVAAFRNNIAAMLQENESLETLSIHSDLWIKDKEYIALVAAHQHNTTLKALAFNSFEGPQKLTRAEDKQMATLFKNNYAMESLSDLYWESKAGNLGAILRLNQAGRRYLIEDGSSVSKGVEVLSAVRSDINCVFFHLLENPSLCNRSAVEVASNGNTEEEKGSTNPASRKGKREQGQALEEGTEPRRQRT
jgi:hypothetical protein